MQVSTEKRISGALSWGNGIEWQDWMPGDGMENQEGNTAYSLLKTCSSICYLEVVKGMAKTPEGVTERMNNVRRSLGV